MKKMLLGIAKNPKTIKLRAAERIVPAVLALIIFKRSLKLVYLQRPLYTFKTTFTANFENNETTKK